MRDTFLSFISQRLITIALIIPTCAPHIFNAYSPLVQQVQISRVRVGRVYRTYDMLLGPRADLIRWLVA